jgi:hypothetical protein
MASANENISSILVENGNILNRSQSLVWRMIHGTQYMLGSLCFSVGSFMFFTDVMKQFGAALDVGGWLFTIGSTLFLFADLQEWWYYRIGCIFDYSYRKAFEASNGDLFSHSQETIFGRIERALVGINFFGSVCGSALYLAGSILFIPALGKYLEIGEWLFIFGSTVTFLSQAWKVYRSACTNVNDRHDHRLNPDNLLSDTPGLLVNSFAGLGAFYYLLGSILFLPYLNVQDSNQNQATVFFVCGGIGFVLAGFFAQYNYYCTRTSEYQTVVVLNS